MLGLPIITGMISQNILNLVDTAMVGSLGNASLAAVGIGGFFTFMAQSLFMGMSSGVQSISARRWGENKFGELAKPLNGGLLFVLLAGVPFASLLFFQGGHLFSLLIKDPEVMQIGMEYVTWRMPGIVAIGFNFSFRGYWNGVGRPSLYLRAIVLMHIINIVLNYVLIFGKFGFPALGAKGSAMGTTLALFSGSTYYFVQSLKHAKGNGFMSAFPSMVEFKRLLSIAIPSGMQIMFFSAGFTVEFWIIGMIGTAELAAANVLINIMLICILPGIALGIAAGSLVGQELGKGNRSGAKQWGWDVAKVSMLGLTLLGLPMVVFPHAILSVFIHEPPTLELAVWPLIMIGATISIEALALVLINAQLGAGDSKRILVSTALLQWAFFLPLAFLVGPTMGFGLIGIWICHIVYRLILAIVMIVMWKNEKWADIRL